MKIFIANFNRASTGLLIKLQSAMKKMDMLTNNYVLADYILAVGDRIETFDFCLQIFRENKKVIHLWAGEISQGTHDEVYRHSLTMMSMMQLCTDKKSFKRVKMLCKAIDKKPNAFIIGNMALDDMETFENSREHKYNLVLYNPPTNYSREEVQKENAELEQSLINEGIDYLWIEPNGDANSDVIKYNIKNQDRKTFLTLMKYCEKFYTNSSCATYEAPFLLKLEQIIHVGERNKNREQGDIKIGNSTEKIIKIFEGLQ